jgi:hypothetical protein
MALEFVYRGENGANLAEPRPGPFPGTPGAGLGPEASQNQQFPVLPPQKHALSLKSFRGPFNSAELLPDPFKRRSFGCTDCRAKCVVNVIAATRQILPLRFMC